ncbi:MAG TPA: hypothetical protein VMJ93_13945 [Verrucomicrobiae bacterium]|nr:hypothetical protein [Verrucomicrobiae bacterium]
MPDWPHSPMHRLGTAGAYIVTAGTYQKKSFFATRSRLTYLCERLLHHAAAHGLKLQAWSVFPNHYHFVAISLGSAVILRKLLNIFHAQTSRHLNKLDETPGRRVWFQYWDSHLTYERSYLARLNYVHTNAVRHGLVREPAQYEWCSAGWFERTAEKPFHQTVMRMRSEGVSIQDDFEVNEADIE